jgi:hypothetical protein
MTRRTKSVRWKTSLKTNTMCSSFLWPATIIGWDIDLGLPQNKLQGPYCDESSLVRNQVVCYHGCSDSIRAQSSNLHRQVNLYYATPDQQEKKKTVQVVELLVESFVGTYRTIYVDCFYTRRWIYSSRWQIEIFSSLGQCWPTESLLVFGQPRHHLLSKRWIVVTLWNVDSHSRQEGCNMSGRLNSMLAR